MKLSPYSATDMQTLRKNSMPSLDEWPRDTEMDSEGLKQLAKEVREGHIAANSAAQKIRCGKMTQEDKDKVNLETRRTRAALSEAEYAALIKKECECRRPHKKADNTTESQENKDKRNRKQRVNYHKNKAAEKEGKAAEGAVKRANIFQPKKTA